MKSLDTDNFPARATGGQKYGKPKHISKKP